MNWAVFFSILIGFPVLLVSLVALVEWEATLSGRAQARAGVLFVGLVTLAVAILAALPKGA